jgi:hypothetical protein
VIEKENDARSDIGKQRPLSEESYTKRSQYSTGKNGDFMLF